MRRGKKGNKDEEREGEREKERVSVCVCVCVCVCERERERERERGMVFTSTISGLWRNTSGGKSFNKTSSINVQVLETHPESSDWRRDSVLPKTFTSTLDNGNHGNEPNLIVASEFLSETLETFWRESLGGVATRDSTLFDERLGEGVWLILVLTGTDDDTLRLLLILGLLAVCCLSCSMSDDGKWSSFSNISSTTSWHEELRWGLNCEKNSTPPTSCNVLTAESN